MDRDRPNLTVAQVLAWADAHHARTGGPPRVASGPVADAPGEDWRAINSALRRGLRGLPGGESLGRLLVRHGRRPAVWANPGARAWTAAEDELVRTQCPAEVARRTGRSLTAVYLRRHRLTGADRRQHW
jgi:hypothetical protein